MPLSDTFNKALLGIAILSIVSLPIFHFLQSPSFHQVFAVEDGPAEWGTAICLFLSFIVLARYAWGFMRAGRYGATAAVGLYALLFLFASGEEISWGQRIFGWQAGEFFTNNSYRTETNLHNLKIGDVKLVKVLFGNILTPILLIYLLILPHLYPRIGWVQRQADRLAIPVPHVKHMLIVLAASLVIWWVDLPRKWEFYEFIFSLMALSIFMEPLNRKAFPGGKPEQS